MKQAADALLKAAREYVTATEHHDRMYWLGRMHGICDAQEDLSVAMRVALVVTETIDASRLIREASHEPA